MSNQQLTAATVGLVFAHLLAMGAALLMKRGPWPVAGLNLAVAVAVLIYLVSRPRWLQPPVDWPVAGLALFELLVLGAAFLALRRSAPAVAVSWAMFAIHFLVSGAALAFALTFKITRLI